MKEPLPPSTLLEMQKWFGNTISLPLKEDHKLPLSEELQKKAHDYITPNPHFAPYQRVEIYHQQYWWRLLNVLQTTFPFVTRLFGYTDFNELIAVPYLLKYPPKYWFLSGLGHYLPTWCQNDYHGSDRELVHSCASLDWAIEKAFWIKKHPETDFSTLSQEEILNQKLLFQPHVEILTLKGDFLSLREVFLKEDVDYWSSNPFPSLHCGNFYYVIYRHLNNQVTWKKISYEEFYFLSQLKEGLTINEVCEKIEEEQGTCYETAQIELPLWFREWIYLKWFSLYSRIDSNCSV